MAVAPEAVTLDIDTATGSLVLNDLPVPDFIGETSGQPDLSLPATLSLAMAWSYAGAAITIDDPAMKHSGSYAECQATITWSAREDGFSFQSAGTGSTTVRFAQIGIERTGIFAEPGRPTA